MENSFSLWKLRAYPRTHINIQESSNIIYVISFKQFTETAKEQSKSQEFIKRGMQEKLTVKRITHVLLIRAPYN
jgi:hypothetical protein